MQSLDSIATHYPYIFSGLASTVVYFLFQKFFAKKSLQSSIMSSLIFGLWFSLAWFIWYSIGNSLNSDTTIGNNLNRYTIGIFSCFGFFLYSLLIKRQPLAKAAFSTGLFATGYIIAEAIFTLVNNMNI